MRYRRSRTAGGTYFFTANLADRSQRLLTEHIDVLRSVTHKIRSTHPFEITAIVVLPDHLHTVWVLPAGDADYATRWSLIKAGFSRGVARYRRVGASRAGKREREVWQRRYWEHQIRDARDLEMHVDYIHYNPVKHGYVDRAVSWPYSSLHRYIRAGVLSPVWGARDGRLDGNYGER